MRCALMSKGLYDIATGKTVKPSANDQGKLNEFIKSDGTAMILLTSALGLSQITLTENCNSSKKILDKLDSVYIQKSETNKM